MIIQQIRNATVKIRYHGITFLIDPWFQDRGTGFSAKAIKPEMQGVPCPINDLPDSPEKILSEVQLCLVTHLHFDHFTSDYLPKHMEIVAQNEYDAGQIHAMGFEAVKWFESDTIQIGNITIHKVEAIHGENEAVAKKMGEACGYVFEASDEKTLYIAGDTVYCQAVVNVINQHQPEVILLNCCGATVPMGRLIMDLGDVEAVCQAASQATVIASHLDSVNHAMVTSDDVRAFVLKKGFSQIIVPQTGESIEI